MEGTMRFAIFAMALAAVLVTGACATRGEVPPASTGPTFDSYGHELVTVAPGVQVIANYDEPIFYFDRFYWRFQSGNWYRSPIHTAGWLYAPEPPLALRRLKRPETYVHYRPPAAHTHQARARAARRPEPAKSMYQSPPRRLRPLQPPESRPRSMP
jgi:hypothetical protein